MCCDKRKKESTFLPITYSSHQRVHFDPRLRPSVRKPDILDLEINWPPIRAAISRVITVETMINSEEFQFDSLRPRRLVAGPCVTEQHLERALDAF